VARSEPLPGEQDHRQLRDHGLDDPQQFDAVHALHLEVDPGHVENRPAQDADGLAPGPGHLDAQPPTCQPPGKHVREARLVVHQQQAQGPTGRIHRVTARS
jgi:hypothetical protein